MLNNIDKVKYNQFNDDAFHTVFTQIDDKLKPNHCINNHAHKWDNEHVRMPCSPLSFHPIERDGHKSLVPRWQLIRECLKTKISNVNDLKCAILGYNSRFESQWDFEILHTLFESHVEEEYRSKFFNDIYPKMVDLTLDLPNLVTKSIPLLKSNKFHSISFSQKQIASLLANAFFCTYPRRNRFDDESEYRNFPRINFSSLFNSNRYRRQDRNSSKIEKLKCILHYFECIVENMPNGVVTFTRRVLKSSDLVSWENSECLFQDIELRIQESGSIFDSGMDSIKIDFANKFVGGAVLTSGCVQEEILFVTQPELIVSCLFTEVLGDGECLLVQGTKSFSSYTGYSNTFHFIPSDATDANHQVIDRDKYGRLRNTIAMIDAINFRSFDDQFERTKMIRDLNKAYCGFSDIMPFQDALPVSISTGNWGCGAFKGDIHLKFILQLIVCAQLKKNMTYYTFNNAEFALESDEMFRFLKDSQCTVGSLWKCLCQYHSLPKKPSLFDHIRSNSV